MQKRDSLAISLIRAQLFLLAVPLGPLNVIFGLRADIDYLRCGSYHGVLERTECPDGTVMVKRGMPFKAIFHPCAHLIRSPWEKERARSTSGP